MWKVSVVQLGVRCAWSRGVRQNANRVTLHRTSWAQCRSSFDGWSYAWPPKPAQRRHSACRHDPSDHLAAGADSWCLAQAAHQALMLISCSCRVYDFMKRIEDQPQWNTGVKLSQIIKRVANTTHVKQVGRAARMYTQMFQDVTRYNPTLQYLYLCWAADRHRSVLPAH